jgi:predicted nuclease with RNAse H fold
VKLTDPQPGDLIDWLGVPVLVIVPPTPMEIAHNNWNGVAAYLRVPEVERSGQAIIVGELRTTFNMGEKHTWEGELSGHEEALIMKLLLTGSI